jgi:polysaccharide biosynthesis/export protein
MNYQRKGETMNRCRKWIVFYALIVIAAMSGFAQEQKDAFIKDYKIGPKDLLEIKVVEVPELNLTVRVSESGLITLPLLGRVDLGGLTKEAAERRIATMLEEKYVNNPQVTVFIREYQSNRLTLIGAVRTPGMYEIVGDMNLLELISKAGGFAENAGDELFVMRKGNKGIKERITIDLNNLILKGDPNLNIPLQPNDDIIVPVDMIVQVYVWGEVRNPGALSVKISKKITLLQAIAQAGGTTDSAKKSGIIIKRKDEKTSKEIQMTFNLNDIIKGKKPDPPLREGDVVYVPTSFW